MGLDVYEIMPNLFLCGVFSATEQEILEGHKITSILTLGAYIEPKSLKSLSIKYEKHRMMNKLILRSSSLKELSSFKLHLILMDVYL